jgi:hypothetical protein
MKKIILLIQISLFTFAFNAFPKSVQAEDVVGKVLAVQGTIEYRRGTTPVAENKLGEVKTVSFTPWEKVKFGQAVYKSDEFKTARASRLKIKFDDNSLIALGPNASMQVQAYRYNSKQKLRQATISVAKGLAMYIINKSQKNKKSRFKMVSPIGNIASRGTHGYFAVGTDKVLVANQAGAVESSNSDPNVVGSQTVGAMEKTIITEGNPPLPPVALTNNEVSSIRNLVLGRVGTSSTATGTEKPLIAVEETTEEDEQEEEKKADDSSSDSDDSSTDSKEAKDADKEDKADSDSQEDSGDTDTKTADSTDGPESGDKQSDPNADTQTADNADRGPQQTDGPGLGDSTLVADAGGAGLGGPDFSIGGDFLGDLGGFGGPEDFAQVNDPFPAVAASCSP